MPASMLPTFFLYCLTTLITPGPANLCCLSAALRYGKAVALRQQRGLLTGALVDSAVAMAVSRLLGNVLGGYVRYLTWVGAAYILWLAWRLFRNAGKPPKEIDKQPSFVTGLLLNLTNAKMILFFLTAMSSFLLPYTTSVIWLLGVGVFLPVMGTLCNLVWLVAGTRLQSVFARFGKPVDVVMAIALALCAVSLVLPS